MLFCERDNLRTTRKVQNTTLKSYKNAKKLFETLIDLCSGTSVLNSQVDLLILFEFHSTCSPSPG